MVDVNVAGGPFRIASWWKLSGERPRNGCDMIKVCLVKEESQPSSISMPSTS